VKSGRRGFLRAAAAAIGVACFGLRAASAQPAFDIYDLGALGTGGLYGHTEPTDINNAGRVVGTTNIDVDGSGTPVPFLWFNGEMQCLDTLDGHCHGALDSSAAVVERVFINDLPMVAGTVRVRLSNGQWEWRAFIWTPDAGIRFLLTGGRESEVTAIGDNGAVAGRVFSVPFVLINGIMNFNLPSDVRIYGINAAGHMVGNRTGSIYTIPILIRDGKMMDLPDFQGYAGANSGTAWAINDRQEIYGTGTFKDIWRTWHYRDGVLEVLDRSVPSPNDLNNSGDIVGSVEYVRQSVPFTRTHAALYRGREKKVIDLDKDLASGSDWVVLEEATGINDSGWIVGFGYRMVNKLLERRGFLMKPRQ
jgi:hypothetical protein